MSDHQQGSLNSGQGSSADLNRLSNGQNSRDRGPSSSNNVSNLNFDDDSNLSQTEMSPYAQDRFLRFSDPVLEAAYVRHMVPSISVPLLVAYFLLSLVAVSSTFLSHSGLVSTLLTPFGLYIPLVFVIFCILRCLQSKFPHRTEHYTAIGRSLVFGTALSGFWAGLVIFHGGLTDDCSSLYFYTNQKMAQEEPNCHRRTNPDLFGTIGAFMLIRMHRYVVIVPLCVLGTVLHLTVWLLFPTPRFPLITVGMSTAITAVGFWFALVVCYTQEAANRRRFRMHRQLETQLDELRTSRNELLVFCKGVLPETLLKKSAAEGAVVLSGSTAVDESANAVVGLVGVHDLVRTGAKQLDIEVATFISALQEYCQAVAQSLNLERVMTLGDQFAVVGNLMAPLRSAPEAVAVFGLRVAGFDNKIPLRAGVSVHCGAMHGRFVGSKWVRYDVGGPAITTATRMLLLAGGGEVVSSKDVVDGIRAGLVEMRESFSADDINEVGLEKDALELFRIGFVENDDDAASDTARSNVSGNPLESRVLSPAPVDEAEERSSLQAVDRILSLSMSQNLRSHSTHAVSQHTEVLQSSAQRSVTPSKKRAAGTLAKVDLSYEIVRSCCVFERFVDDEAEKRFQVYRLLELADSSPAVWFAYSAYLTAVLIFVLLDLQEAPWQPFGVLNLVFGIVSALFVGSVPRLLGNTFIVRHGMLWSVFGLFVPLLAMYGCALSRPSAMGNDVRALFIVAALVRSFVFPNVKIETVVTPILVIVASFQYALPGAVMRFVFSNYAVSLWAVLVDISVERAQRQNFVTLAELNRLVPLLAEETRLREGLLESTLPGIFFEELVRDNVSLDEVVTMASIRSQNDTAVAIVTTLQTASQKSAADALFKRNSRPATMDGSAFDQLEASLRPCPSVSVVGVSGDRAMLATPISSRPVPLHRREQALVDCTRAMITLVGEEYPTNSQPPAKPSAQFSVLLEFDTVVIYLRLGRFPRMGLFGVAVRKLLCLSSSAVEIPPGLLATDQAARTVAKTVLGPSIAVAPLVDRWAVRGVGVIRMNSIRPHGSSDNEECLSTSSQSLDQR